MKNKLYTHAIVTGSIAYDDIMDFPGKFVDFIQADKLHQINVSFVVDKLEKQIGGTATNIAYNLRLASDVNFHILGAVGRDGDVFFNFLKKNNINASGVLVDKNLYTATGKVITDQQDNQIWGFYYGASVKGREVDVKKFITPQTIMLISATHKDSYLHYQHEAIKQHIDYIYDPGMIITTLSAQDLREGLIHAKYVIANDYEIAQILKMTGLTVKQLLQEDVAVITTLGEKGVLFQSKDEEYTIPSFLLKKVIDPTGAGDAWRGGFVAGLISGLSIKECLEQGNALASFAVEHYGTVNHTPSVKEIKSRKRQIQLQPSSKDS